MSSKPGTCRYSQRRGPAAARVVTASEMKSRARPRRGSDRPATSSANHPRPHGVPGSERERAARPRPRQRARRPDRVTRPRDQVPGSQRDHHRNPTSSRRCLSMAREPRDRDVPADQRAATARPARARRCRHVNPEAESNRSRPELLPRPGRVRACATTAAAFAAHQTANAVGRVRHGDDERIAHWSPSAAEHARRDVRVAVGEDHQAEATPAPTDPADRGSQRRPS